MTPYTAAQLARKEKRMQRKCEKLNYYRNICCNRIGVKHAFAELKQYNPYENYSKTTAVL